MHTLHVGGHIPRKNVMVVIGSMVCSLAGCNASSGPATPAGPASVSVTLASASVEKFTTTQASFVVKDAGGNVLSGQTVTWAVTSATPVNAARVDAASGLVTAEAPGNATITATVTGTTPPITGDAQVTVTPVAFVEIKSGQQTTCARTAAGAAYCWGRNSAGEIGDNTIVTRTAPTPVSGSLAFVSISAGGGHVCGRTATATYCWGNNTRGQIGDGTTVNRSVPTLVSGGIPFVDIQAATFFACGRVATGAAYCWGMNVDGRLGDNSTTDRLVPTQVSGGMSFTYLSVKNNGCGIVSPGAAYCWGFNIGGSVGDNTTTNRQVPTAVAGGLTFLTISPSWNSFTCGLVTGGAAYCWGFNPYGQVGDSSTTTRLVPTRVAGGLTFVEVESGGNHACGRTAGGAVYCWGLNSRGQLGDNTTTDRLVPTRVTGDLAFVRISLGFEHTCGLIANGAAYCWGQPFGVGSGDVSRDYLAPVPARMP